MKDKYVLCTKKSGIKNNQSQLLSLMVCYGEKRLDRGILIKRSNLTSLEIRETEVGWVCPLTDGDEVPWSWATLEEFWDATASAFK